MALHTLGRYRRFVMAGLDDIWVNRNDTIGSDDSTIDHIATLATFFARSSLRTNPGSEPPVWPPLRQ